MNIGFNIKKLRRERDITQEQLAEYLNISVSAISQWECGKTTPDISMLAPLANILDVSADVLFGIDVKNKEKQINDIILRANEYINKYDKEKAIPILREGLKEYPNSYKIMERLMVCLGGAKRGKATDEVIKLGEKILAECTEDRIRLGALNKLCSAYASPEIDMTEKAIELAEKLPSVQYACEDRLADLYEGEEKIKQYRNNIGLYFGNLIRSMGNYNSIEPDIIISKKIVNLIEVMIEDGNYGFFGFYMSHYSSIALNYAKSNEYDKAIKNLHLSSDNAIKTDTEYNGIYYEYTSLLLRGTPNFLNFRPEDRCFSREVLEKMKNSAFDPIRKHDDFIEIEEKLKKYAENR